MHDGGHISLPLPTHSHNIRSMATSLLIKCDFSHFRPGLKVLLKVIRHCLSSRSKTESPDSIALSDASNIPSDAVGGALPPPPPVTSLRRASSLDFGSIDEHIDLMTKLTGVVVHETTKSEGDMSVIEDAALTIRHLVETASGPALSAAFPTIDAAESLVSRALLCDSAVSFVLGLLDAQRHHNPTILLYVCLHVQLAQAPIHWRELCRHGGFAKLRVLC